MGSVCCQPCSCALPRYASVRSRQPNPMAETTAVRAPSTAERSRPASCNARAAAASDHVESRSKRRVLTFGSTSAVRKGKAGRAYRTPAVGQAVTTDGTGKGPWSGPLTGPHGPTDPSPVMSISRWLMPVQSDVAQALVPDASAFVAGRAILPAAAFQAALLGRVGGFGP